MNKKSSYQKQKDKIESLKYDIQALRGRYGFDAKAIVDLKYNLMDNAEAAIWAGDTFKIVKDE